MEQLPWPAITAASGGWVLFAWLAWTVFRKLTSGELVTRREAEAIREESVWLRGSNDHLRQQLETALEAATTSNEHLGALRRAAEAQSP